jgi:hypothetical protein
MRVRRLTWQSRFSITVILSAIARAYQMHPQCSLAAHIVIGSGASRDGDWGVTLRKGRHEPLISVETYERIQENLRGKAGAPASKDLHEDAPLRGAVVCGNCGTPLTACWPKGELGRRYAYYLCFKRGCLNYRKSIGERCSNGCTVATFASPRISRRRASKARA